MKNFSKYLENDKKKFAGNRRNHLVRLTAINDHNKPKTKLKCDYERRVKCARINRVYRFRTALEH